MMEFILDKNPLDAVLATMQPGDTMCALDLIALLEGESEQTAQDALAELELRGIQLDLSRMPADSGTGETAVRLRQEQQLAQQADMRQGLEETDPLRVYLEEMAAIPVAGDIQRIALDYAAGAQELVQKLTDLSLGRVVELAAQHTGHGVLLMDLIQEGNLGLWQGILQYAGGAFETHRDWWIRQYMAKAVVLQARADGLGQKLRQGLEDYRDVELRLLGELGRTPAPEEIAQQLRITPDEVRLYESMLAAAQARQLPEQSEEEEPDSDQAVEDTAYFQLRQRIQELLSTLSERDARLLTLRYGLEGGMPMDPQEVGKRLGMTPQEVMETEANTLAQLRRQG